VIREPSLLAFSVRFDNLQEKKPLHRLVLGMTTFSPSGGESVGISLISGEEFRHGQTQPSPQYQPELLETGDGGLPNAQNNNNSNGISNIIRIFNSECIKELVNFVDDVRFVISQLLFFTLLFATIYKLRRFFFQVPQQDIDDAMVWKCYSYPSHAFAESDMLLLPDSPPSSSENMDINPVEEVIRKAPQIAINKSFRFLLVLDSSINITGIVDFENQRCYVMQLLQYSFEPEESLCDTLFRMLLRQTGYYSLANVNKILSYFHMVKPAITNIYDYGIYISRHCADYPTFKMERDIVTDSP